MKRTLPDRDWKNFMDSASVDFVNMIFTLSLREHSLRRFANCSALSMFPYQRSRHYSGKIKIIVQGTAFSEELGRVNQVKIFPLIAWSDVYPIGTVDLIAMVASVDIFLILSKTFSIELISKDSVLCYNPSEWRL